MSDTAAAASFTIPVILYVLAVTFIQTLLYGVRASLIAMLVAIALSWWRRSPASRCSSPGSCWRLGRDDRLTGRGHTEALAFSRFSACRHHGRMGAEPRRTTHAHHVVATRLLRCMGVSVISRHERHHARGLHRRLRARGLGRKRARHRGRHRALVPPQPALDVGQAGRSDLWREIMPFWVLSFAGLVLSTMAVALTDTWTQAPTWVAPPHARDRHRAPQRLRHPLGRAVHAARAGAVPPPEPTGVASLP